MTHWLKNAKTNVSHKFDALNHKRKVKSNAPTHSTDAII